MNHIKNISRQSSRYLLETKKPSRMGGNTATLLCIKQYVILLNRHIVKENIPHPQHVH
jgi:hypothetical protein